MQFIPPLLTREGHYDELPDRGKTPMLARRRRLRRSARGAPLSQSLVAASARRLSRGVHGSARRGRKEPRCVDFDAALAGGARFGALGASVGVAGAAQGKDRDPGSVSSDEWRAASGEF